MIDSFRGEHAFLSNFYYAKTNWAGKTFPTVEHGYAAAKALCFQDALDGVSDNESHYWFDKIASASTPSEAKKLGRSLKIDIDYWEGAKVVFMRQLLTAKFNENYDIRYKLIQTSPHMLIEGNTWGDKYWGMVDNDGENVLGCLLMELRGHYLHKGFS